MHSSLSFWRSVSETPRKEPHTHKHWQKFSSVANKQNFYCASTILLEFFYFAFTLLFLYFSLKQRKENKLSGNNKKRNILFCKWQVWLYVWAPFEKFIHAHWHQTNKCIKNRWFVNFCCHFFGKVKKMYIKPYFVASFFAFSFAFR